MKERLFKIVPRYACIPLISVVLVNFTVYYVGRCITKDVVHHNLQFAFEEKIPFWPWMILVYFGCYLFWIHNYISVSKLDRKHALRMYLTDILSKLTCFVFFILLPTTMDRAVITGDGIFDNAVRFLYQIDAADNLFPSIHCLVSWICFIGVRGRKEVPKWYQVVSLILAILVCISTLTLKQHVIVDVIAGILIPELIFFILGRFILTKK